MKRLPCARVLISDIENRHAHITTAITAPQVTAMKRDRDIVLRPYQSRIVEKAIGANTIVVLPTGAGKTLIAGELIKRFGTPAVFLVPTVLLVEQQEAALRSWTNLDVRPYQGGAALPPSFDILVSTPKAFETAQANAQCNRHLQWAEFKTVVFDEVHHVLKEHPYRKLALSLHASEATPRVLGLTASFTYAVGEAKSKAALQTMCDELRTTRLETATEEELRECGYHAMGVTAEIRKTSNTDGIPDGVLPVPDRKPHLMMPTFFSRVLQSEATPFASSLAKCALRMESAVMDLDPKFKPPIQTDTPLKQWGVIAHRLSSSGQNNLRPLYGDLEHWYEALRLLIVSWEEDEYAALLLLRMAKCDDPSSIGRWPRPVAQAINEFWGSVPTKFPRIDELRKTLTEKRKELKDFRGLLFVQQRVTTHLLEYFISTDPELAALFCTASLYAASSPATPSLRVTRSEAKKRIQRFANGEVNLLITTVVAEEGMDIPAANCVIRFDAMHHAVSLVQGRGRARQEQSAFVVLKERTDRPHSVLAEVEKQQLELIRTFQPTPSEQVNEKQRKAQTSRETAAKSYLAGDADLENAMFKLRNFCQKTKVSLDSKYLQQKNQFAVLLQYTSVLRTVTTQGNGPNKKTAAAKAALQMVVALRTQIV